MPLRADVTRFAHGEPVVRLVRGGEWVWDVKHKDGRIWVFDRGYKRRFEIPYDKETPDWDEVARLVEERELQGDGEG